MRAAPIRFLNAVFWPFTIWFSLTHLEEHAADDFVERTSPIVAFAIGFWICAASLSGLWYMIHPGSLVSVAYEGGEQTVRLVRRWPQIMFDVFVWFTPAIYVIGFWMFSARDGKYPR